MLDATQLTRYTNGKKLQGRAAADVTATLQAAAQRVQQAAAAGAATLIEWADGPLVQAMKQGDILLIDELNLADDAVLERLNRYNCHCSHCLFGHSSSCIVHDMYIATAN